MALDGEEQAQLAAIIFETPADVASLVDGISAELESFILERMALYPWNSFVKLKGGSSGVDFDNERKRAGIRAELRTLLGLDPVSDLDPMFESLQIFELEVGSNFG